MRLFTSVALALVACASPALAQGTQTKPTGELRWNLKAGDTMRYAFTWILDEKGEVQGMGDMGGGGRTFEVGYSLDQKVKSVDDKGAVIEATIASVRGRLGMGMMGEMTYDSSGTPDAESPMAWLRHLVGKSFTFTMTSRGEITNVTGGDALRAEVVEVVKKEAAAKPKAPQGGGDDGMGGMMDPSAMMGMLATQLTVVFTDTSLRSALEVTNDVLPTTAAKEGETWTRPIVEQLPEIGTLSYTALYTHRGGTADATRITSRAEGEIKMEKAKKEEQAADPNADPMAEMMKRMQESMNERLETKRKAATGTHSFSATKGRLLDSEVVQEIVMEGPLPPEAAMMMGEQAKDMKFTRTLQLTLRYLAEEAPAGGAKPADKPKDDKGRSY
jgi:hypothetical protein